jgi:hypothetical protein
MVARDPWGGKVELSCSDDNVLDISTRIEKYTYEGLLFFSNYHWDANLNQSANILVVIPDDDGRYPFWTNIVSTVETSYQVYIGPTVTDNGVALNRINRNQNYDANLSKTLIYRDCTYSDPGLLGYETRWGSGNKVGGATDRQLIVMKRATAYLFIVTSRAAANHITHERATAYLFIVTSRAAANHITHESNWGEL